MPRGRPPLTDEDVRARIADYCSRYGVAELNESGFPVYPAGARETPQHRAWVILYKAWSRARQRAAHGDGAAVDEGRCPICLTSLDSGRTSGRTSTPIHPRCRQLVELVEELGPAALDRAKRYLKTRGQGSGRPSSVD
jgi:hypothetical protein